MFLFVFWLRIGHPLSMYVTRGMEGVIQNAYRCVQGEKSIELHVYILTYISFQDTIMSCFICRNLTLPLSKKSVSVRNGYFPPIRSISVVMKLAFFYFNLLFRTKVVQNGFNFNQIESWVYSKF